MRPLLALLTFWRRPPAPPPEPMARHAPLSEPDWLRYRAPLRHRDASLSDAALRWLAHFPADVRPTALGERHPRIVNRFAGLWRDPGLTEHYLDELTASRRPQRQGFAPEIVAELEALRLCNEQRLYAADDDPA